MIKNYNEWNEVKKAIDQKLYRKFFKEREVWWCNLGCNIGDEEDGKGKRFTRPVLVIKKFNRNLLVSLPLTTAQKDKPYYYNFEFKDRQQAVILSQIRLLDSKRLYTRLGTMPDPELKIIKEKVVKLIF